MLAYGAEARDGRKRQRRNLTLRIQERVRAAFTNELLWLLGRCKRAARDDVSFLLLICRLGTIELQEGGSLAW